MKRIVEILHRYLFALLSSLYLFTLGLSKARNRILIEHIASHFGYVRIRTTLPKAKIGSLTDENATIQLREPVVADGNVTLLELITIVKLVQKYQPSRLLEIGTFDGRTTLNLAANSPSDAEVFTLDLPKSEISAAHLPLAPHDQRYINKDVSGARFQGTECEGKIVQIYGDSASFDFSPYFDSIDFIFVDGSHAYEYVLSDSRAALKLLRRGQSKAVILWHDYGVWEGVTRALEELANTDPNFQGLQHIENTALAFLLVG